VTHYSHSFFQLILIFFILSLNLNINKTVYMVNLNINNPIFFNDIILQKLRRFYLMTVRDDNSSNLERNVIFN